MPKLRFIAVALLSLSIFVVSVSGQEPICQPFDFRVASAFDIGANSLSYTTADFNGDGVLDVAVPNYDRNTASIAYGDGTSGFAPPVPFPAGLNPRSIASGDMNNDGRPDIIVAGTADLIGVMLANAQGNGFLAPILYDPPPTSFGQFEELKTGDFNGDSHLDVAAVQNQSGKVLKVFWGDGSGNISFGTSFSVGGSDSKLIVGHLNADAIVDIVISSGSHGGPRAVNFVYGSSTGLVLTPGFSLNDHAIGISITDLNEDGLKDLAIAFYDSTTPTNHFLQPWLQTGGGTFTGGTVFDLSYPFIPSDLTTGDYDGDGNVDMAVMLESMVMVAYGTGTGNFERHTTWATSSSRLIFTNDVDSDAHPDLVTLSTTGATNNVMSVLFNESGGFVAPRTALWGPHLMAAADFNNDQLQDYASAWETSFASPSGADISLNDGMFGFLPEVHQPSPIGLSGLSVGDFNGDGKADAITTHSNNGRTVAVYHGKGDGTLEVPITTSINVAFEDLIVADLNNDSKDDVFLLDSSARGHSWLSNGNGTFSPTVGFSLIQFQNIQVKFEKALYNNDQFVDLIIGTGPSVAIWLGDGTGKFTQLSTTIPQMADVTVGDYNNDGVLDLAGFWTPGLVIALGDGSGGFLTPISTAFTGTGKSLVSGDLNGDGSDDFAFYRENFDLHNLVIVPGSPTLPTTPTYYSVGSINRDLLAKDYNNDGNIDLGFLGSKARGVIYGRTSSEPCISVADKQVNEGNSGELVAEVAVNLSAASEQDVSVNYVVAAGTATAGTDFLTRSGRLVIPAGETSATITVPILPDLLDEFDETFTVTLSSASNASIVRAGATGTIVDDDDEPTITIADVTRPENGTFSALFTVTLSAPSGRNVSFRFATRNGSAIAEQDYFPVNNIQTIQAGGTSVVVGVGVSGDSMFEPDEEFFADLSEPINGTIADGTGTATLINDDQVPTITIFGSSVREGDVGTNPVNLTLQLSNPTYLPVNLSLFTSNGTAIGGVDYVHYDGPAVIPAGQQSVTFPIQTIGDTIDERTESFFVNMHQVQNANAGNVQASLTIVDDEATRFDFDGDGRSDVSVYRESDTTWHIYRSQGSYLGIVWGLPNDKPVPEDYDGDGRTNAAMFRDGLWLIRNNTGNGHVSLQWGAPGDKPVPADYDGDGRADQAVYRDGVWWIYRSTEGPMGIQWGSPTDIPVPADYDGDGKADVAVVRDGVWWILQSSLGATGIQWGQAGDKPAPADYDGDGKADVAVVRDGTWWIFQSTAGPTGVAWGTGSDIPVPADYDGDGKSDIAIFRQGMWWIYQSSLGPTGAPWGVATDVPIPSKD